MSEINKLVTCFNRVDCITFKENECQTCVHRKVEILRMPHNPQEML